jgi:hypothetical protein
MPFMGHEHYGEDDSGKHRDETTARFVAIDILSDCSSYNSFFTSGGGLRSP